MKIVKEEKIENINYPKLEEIGNNTIKQNSLKKWHRFGITSLIISLLLKNNVFASEINNHIDIKAIELAGDVVNPDYHEEFANPATTFSSIVENILPISQLILSVIFLTILAKVIISTIIAKVKKKEYKPKLITEISLVILFIIIVILTFLKCC